MKPLEFESLIDALAELEDRIGQLYKAYARRFPDSADFWRRLAQEEHNHSLWLSSFLDLIHAGVAIQGEAIEAGEKAFDAETVAALSSVVREEVKRAASIDEEHAFQTALRIERDYLERDFQRLIKSADEQGRIIMEKLETETRNHMREIAAELAKRKG